MFNRKKWSEEIKIYEPHFEKYTSEEKDFILEGKKDLLLSIISLEKEMIKSDRMVIFVGVMSLAAIMFVCDTAMKKINSFNIVSISLITCVSYLNILEYISSKNEIRALESKLNLLDNIIKAEKKREEKRREEEGN